MANDSRVNMSNLSKNNNHEGKMGKSKWDRKDKMEKRHKASEGFISSKKFCSDRICLKSNYNDERVKQNEKGEYGVQWKEVARKQNVGPDYASLERGPADGETILETNHDDLSRFTKDSKSARKKKGNIMVIDNSTPATHGCNFSNDKEHERKRKRINYRLELGQSQGCSKKHPRLASCKENESVIEDDSNELPSRKDIGNKMKKKNKNKILNCDSVLSAKVITQSGQGDQGDRSTRSNHSKKLDVRTMNVAKCSSSNISQKSEHMKAPEHVKKRVRFSNEVEEFPPSPPNHEGSSSHNFVMGKRFTPEEDELIKTAVMSFIERKQLGEQGLDMVLHVNRYPQLKGCWNEIASSIPWRPPCSVYNRAHSLYERSENCRWEPEEYELLKRYHMNHGTKWRKLADLLGKYRGHVKDTWRRIRLSNRKRGRWSQDECQSLYDLVNLDLRIKAFQKKDKKYGLIRQNISWEAISTKLATRPVGVCSDKWYHQLASSMVQEGYWNDLDDYVLIDATL
ncbi:hypothetical protein AXF42_Ash008386 [Apostasia shenzhenica]|uniref:Myb-like domain-containing protein n=1 Tax=Apostasia shenzhenica TaxID=1088818 RepID=A0A2I0AXQ1_9ASPA|nr:hypothetical protein AXF42_Ash008386 [Apostasia shenzhenica]